MTAMTNATPATKRAPRKKAAPAAAATPRPRTPRAAKATAAQPTTPAAEDAALTGGLAPAGWYLTPDDPSTKQYWTGTAWTGPVVAATAPLVAPTQPAPAEPPATPAAAPAVETRPVLFYGRQVETRRPTDGQLAVWGRTAKKLAGVNTDTVVDMEMAALFDRAIKAIQSTMASETDRDWLEDQLLEGAMTLEQAAGIISLTVQAWIGQDPAADTPPAANRPPAKRARRARRS